MIVKIEFTNEDKEAINRIIENEERGAFVQDRIRNIQNPKISKEDFWHSILIGLLTSNQKSGPTSPVFKLLSTKPFPISIDNVIFKLKKESHQVESKLKEFPGIRFTTKISEHICKNIDVLNSEWSRIIEFINKILSSKDKERQLLERNLCNHLMNNFIGIGPKQSRNVLQAMGVTNFEIPIDSRFIKWLKTNIKFSIPINSTVLSSEEYYNFILDIISDLCLKEKIMPAILDACIFASFDDGKWNNVYN
jgi:thermostable 8-oxoguanine DNA glycosylase